MQNFQSETQSFVLGDINIGSVASDNFAAADLLRSTLSIPNIAVESDDNPKIDDDALNQADSDDVEGDIDNDSVPG